MLEIGRISKCFYLLFCSVSKKEKKKKKKVDFFLKLNFFFKKFKQTFLFRKVIYIEIFLSCESGTEW